MIEIRSNDGRGNGYRVEGTVRRVGDRAVLDPPTLLDGMGFYVPSLRRGAEPTDGQIFLDAVYASLGQNPYTQAVAIPDPSAS